jgi:hypothetical protein
MAILLIICTNYIYTLAFAIHFNIAPIEISLVICRVLPKYIEIVKAVDDMSQSHLLRSRVAHLSCLDGCYMTENHRQADVIVPQWRVSMYCYSKGDWGFPYRQMVAALEMSSRLPRTISVLPEGIPYQRGNALPPQLKGIPIALERCSSRVWTSWSGENGTGGSER